MSSAIIDNDKPEVHGIDHTVCKCLDNFIHMSNTPNPCKKSKHTTIIAMVGNQIASDIYDYQLSPEQVDNFMKEFNIDVNDESDAATDTASSSSKKLSDVVETRHYSYNTINEITTDSSHNETSLYYIRHVARRHYYTPTAVQRPYGIHFKLIKMNKLHTVKFDSSQTIHAVEHMLTRMYTYNDHTRICIELCIDVNSMSHKEVLCEGWSSYWGKKTYKSIAVKIMFS